MARIWPLLCCLLTLQAPPPVGADQTTDQTLIQGRWHIVKQIDTEDKVLPLGKDAPEYSFEGEKLFSFSDGEKRELARFRLNPKSTPKEIDWLFVDETTGRVNEANAMKGIYEIEGDTLKLTFGMNDVRPKGFDAKQRTGVLNVLKRVK